MSSAFSRENLQCDMFYPSESCPEFAEVLPRDYRRDHSERPRRRDDRVAETAAGRAQPKGQRAEEGGRAQSAVDHLVAGE